MSKAPLNTSLERIEATLGEIEARERRLNALLSAGNGQSLTTLRLIAALREAIVVDAYGSVNSPQAAAQHIYLMRIAKALAGEGEGK